ncbi:MAG: sigma-70 family RNA polymerase sigma factor [Maribacter dokdonensis]|uniref:RNA polymerase sigma factor n=1 Tax=Flavobacteriaceae TaxID=49546 RepID=UPI0032671D31
MSGIEGKKYWTELQKGNVESLGKLYDLYVDELFIFGMSITKDKTTVLDNIHDLFLNLFKYHSTLGEVINIKSYLFMSLKRALHKKSKLKVITVDDTEILNSISINDLSTPSYESNIINLEHSCLIKQKVSRAMNLLSQNQQEVLNMRYNEERSYEEIADAMSVSISSARTIIYRALKVLRGGILIVLFYFS